MLSTARIQKKIQAYALVGTTTLKIKQCQKTKTISPLLKKKHK